MVGLTRPHSMSMIHIMEKLSVHSDFKEQEGCTALLTPTLVLPLGPMSMDSMVAWLRLGQGLEVTAAGCDMGHAGAGDCSQPP